MNEIRHPGEGRDPVTETTLGPGLRRDDSGHELRQ